MNKNFFLQPEEVVFRSLTEVLKSVGKKYYSSRGKKVVNLIEQIKNNSYLLSGGRSFLEIDSDGNLIKNYNENNN